MKLQKQDLENKLLIRPRKVILLFVSSITLFVFSCKSDIEKVSAFASEMDLPEQSAKDLDVEYSDTGKLQMKFISPTMKRYSKSEEPYFEFPDGIEVYFYDSEEKIESVITANYSIYYDKQQLWEARDSVVARKLLTDERIETEQMFWEAGKQKIYSKVFTKITNEDGIYYGEKGFEAAQDLSFYRLLGSSGTVRVKDEE